MKKWLLILFSSVMLTSLGWGSEPGLTQFSFADEETESFLVAQKAFDDGFYDVAIRYLEQFLARYPKSEKEVEAKLLFGQCYFFKEQYLKAFNIFEELKKYTTQQDAILFWLGETYLKGSDHVQAQNHYQQVLEKYPQSLYAPQALYSLGWSLSEEGKFESAQEHFQKLTQNYPTHELTAEAVFKSGECAYHLYNYKEAIEQFKNYVTKFAQGTRQDQAFFYTGESYYYLEDFENAFAYYAKAQEISHDDKIVFIAKVSRGWCQLKLGQYEAAQKIFDEAKTMAQEKGLPADEILLGEATLFSETGEHPKALEDYNQLIRLFPQSERLAEAYLGKANSTYLLERYKEAIAEYQQILEMAGLSKDIKEKAYFGLAWTFLKNGDTAEAIKNFEAILNQTDSNVTKVSALTQIGDAYQDAGDLPEALRYYDKILQNYPNSAYADYIQYRQGVALLKMDNLEAATLSFQSLKTNYPQSKYLTEADYYLGLAYFKRDDWKVAQEQIERFLQNVPSSHELQAQAQYILGAALYHLKDQNSAMRIFQRIITDFPSETAIVTDAELGIAKCFFDAGDIKEALKRFKIIIYKYPKTNIAFESLLWLGDYYFKTDSLDNAIQYYEQILTEFPGSDRVPEVHFSLSEAYQKSGQFDKAVNELKLINPAPDRELYAKAQLAIADIFSHKFDPKTAAEKYQDIVANAPDFARDALIKLAEIQMQNGNSTAALEQYRKALSTSAGLSKISNSEIQFMIADLYESLNDTKQAVETYLKIPYLYPKQLDWGIKAYLRVARIFEDEEDWENARLVYSKILEYKTEESKFARERLEWIENNNQ